MKDDNTVVVGENRTLNYDFNDNELKINLDPTNSIDPTGINVSVFDLGEFYIVETYDPDGRYLPNTQIISKSRSKAIEVDAFQISSDAEVALRPIGVIEDISLLKDDLLGKTTFGMVQDLLVDKGYHNGLTIILPENGFNEDEVVEVYRTPAPNTVLLVGEALSQANYKLASPTKVAVIVYIALYLIPLTIPIIIAATMGNDASTPDVIGWNWAQYKLTDAYHAMGNKNKVYFNYKAVGTTCESEDQLGEVIDQDPQPGVRINAIDETVTVYVCDELISPPETEPEEESELEPEKETEAELEPEESEDPYIVIEENSNCREGPSQLYPEVAILYPGEKHTVLRRDSAGEWFFINPPGPTKKCWVWGGLGKTLGSPAESVSVKVPPPPPKPDGSLSDLSVSQRNITLGIRDSASVDGDRIRVKVNGEVVLKDYTITKEWKTKSINLKPGDNVITVKALNEGTDSPNTVEIKVSHVVYGNAIQVSGGMSTGEVDTFSIFAP